MLAMLLALGLLLPASRPPPNSWSRGGGSGRLTVSPDGALTLSTALGDWVGCAPADCGLQRAEPSSGEDWLGAYDQLQLGERCSLRYYPASDAFTFERATQHGAQPLWPHFTAHPASPALAALAWDPDYMLKGRLVNLSATSHSTTPPSAPVTGRSDGPLILFSKNSDEGGSGALVLSALDHFEANAPQWSASGTEGVSMWMESATGPYPMINATSAARVLPPPARTSLRAVLVCRGGLKRATMAWGSLLRRFHNTTRSRGAAVSSLSYWDDNAAGYSFWSQVRLPPSRFDARSLTPKHNPSARFGRLGSAREYLPQPEGLLPEAGHPGAPVGDRPARDPRQGPLHFLRLVVTAATQPPRATCRTF